MTADCVTLWIGDCLGPVERACLRSVLRQGHRLALYCYRRPDGVPDGIEVRDAFDVLPESAIFRYRTGSVALFADWFRYELQRRGLGTWLDVDNYLIRPLDMKRTYLMGKQVLIRARPYRRRRETIAIGVLRLPPDSPILPPLLAQFEGQGAPDWLAWHWALWARMRGADLARLPWGTTGPFAISALAERFGLASEALPVEAFNPVPWYRAKWILDPAIALDDVVTEDSFGVHLWNECIKGFKNAPAPAGSFLDRLQREGA